MRSTDNLNLVPKHIMTSLLESPVKLKYCTFNYDGARQCKGCCMMNILDQNVLLNLPSVGHCPKQFVSVY